jgi:signal transduction histidine kinase
MAPMAGQRGVAPEAIVEAAALRLTQMAESNAVLVSRADIAEMLQLVADRARSLGRAEYAAVSTFDAHDKLDRFVFSGVDETMAHLIGDPPEGRGLLGELVRHDQPLRLKDITDHAASCGFPPDHPPMGPFLGTPIRANNRTIGSLYLTRTPGSEPFNDSDDMAMRLLAMQVAVRLSHALASEQESRIALLEERTRIAHDLHDGTIQALYALGLQSEALALRRTMPDEAKVELGSHVARLNALIADIRGYITLLESEIPPTAPDLARDLAFIVRALVPQGIETVLNVRAPAIHEIRARDIEDLLFIAREAVSNAVRHGEPTRVGIDLRQSETETAMAIQDNGKGFERNQVHTGLGSISMRTRAERLGATLSTISIPGMGTTVRVAMPREGNSE